MKLIVLSSAESVHTIRWCNALSKRGIRILLVSQHTLISGLSSDVSFHQLKYKGSKGYFLNTFEFRKLVKQESPDIIHAHYASGYGTLAANSGFEYLLSVWGSDVYDFPNNKFTKYLLGRSLKKASRIFSTSHCMKKQTSNFFNGEIHVIPFGVDLVKFRPEMQKGHKESVRLGVVKVLDHKYGIDNLIEAFALLTQVEYSDITLDIVGDGPKYDELVNLAKALGVYQKINFVGWVDNDTLPSIINSFDIFVVPSRLDSESFGVVAVEAGACAVPCVVSNVGGLPEVVVDGVTGLVARKEDPSDLADKIKTLVADKALRNNLGNNARKRVVDNYDWDQNVESMISHYKEFV
ncbi:glycosyltransferase [Catenovulum sp. SX2]|uniref:glycosyltransferase n=1 Tax=Catenovulum sp. SX2 TaxID=3398614 RepID=UPI003F875D4A